MSNSVGYAVQAAVAFFLTPFILHSLGETRYGVWTLAMGLTGYYGLLDLGFSAGMTQYLTRYLALKDDDKLSRAASSGFVGLACCGVVVVVVSALVALNVSHIFQIPPALTAEVTLVILITGASVALQFPFFTYSAVFTAVQRFDLSNAIGIITRLVSAAATIICLKLSYGLVGLSLTMSGANLLDYVIRWRVAARILPEMKVSYKLVGGRDVSEIMNFGLWNLIIAGSVRLVSYTDALVIAAFMPVSAVAPFAIAVSLRTYFNDIFARIGHVFFPAATELDAQGEQTNLRELYLVSSKFMFLGAIVCGVLAIVWARDFFRLWIGVEYAEPVGYPPVATLFYLLVVGAMISAAQRVGYQVLLGTRQIKLLAELFVAEGVTNLVVSVILVNYYGLVGVALGTLLPALVFQGLLQPFFVCRLLHISFNTYFRKVLLKPIIVTAFFVALLLACSRLERVAHWSDLFLWGSISSVVALFIIVTVGLSKSERESILKRPVALGLAKFRAALST